jgi:hypothetical protein
MRKATHNHCHCLVSLYEKSHTQPLPLFGFAFHTRASGGTVILYVVLRIVIIVQLESDRVAAGVKFVKFY